MRKHLKPRRCVGLVAIRLYVVLVVDIYN